MKKILLIAAATSLLSANAYASSAVQTLPTVIPQTNCGVVSPEGYITISAGPEWFSKVTHKENIERIPGHPDYSYSTKLKAKVAPMINIGGGWYANENFRTELMLSSIINSRFKGSKLLQYPLIGDIDTKVSHKTQIYSLLLKALFDVPVMDQFGAYAGPGIGLSLIKDKSSLNYNDGLITGTHKGKNKINPAFGAFIGINIPLDTSAQFFIEGNYMYFGKSKYKHPLEHLGALKPSGKSYKGFGVSTGFRIGFK